ncbi:zinc-binding alcohol dehydrogenase family protein [Rhodospirillaceae bacterium KN72]|uniref:Zinc-binding alcohol dehydrogenase family protein n=1 Tax=Pacificispira spongiicola TaxID=2729598 RepID=A0A7Y0DXZ6_9PROT|nr:zinc-binding alcohol dehydrogenase family protein [Pacificispira spongiicola]NMM43646.1 zinc-binding alcohol dehydrogenase family protein [Pacificispira spongiicola]
MQSNKSLVCAKPGSLHLEQRPPPRPEPGHALVRTRRVGICGTDYHIFEGKHPFLQYPRVMGHELAVDVVEAPDGSGFATGELCVVNPYIACGDCIACRHGKYNCCSRISVLGVHRDGGMSGLLSVPVRNLLHADGLSADACACVEFLSIGAHAVRRGGVAAGDRVLVVGAGPIGLGAALFSRLAGGEVTVLDMSPERMAAARSILGVDAIGDGVDPAEAISARTQGEGYDIVFDATGNQQSMQAGFGYVAHGGRYVLVSVVNDTITFQDPVFHGREMTLFASRNATSGDFERVIRAMRNGDVPLRELITHRTSLADAVGNIPIWAQNKSGLIKALIVIDD